MRIIQRALICATDNLVDKQKYNNKNMAKYFKRLALCVVLLLCACNARQRVLYLQDVADGAVIELPENCIIRLKPYDQIRIVVNSMNPELAKPFNSSSNYSALIGTNTITTATEDSVQVFTVDREGCIDFPVLGMIRCGGMTRQELAADIERRIIEGGYIADAKVNVSFANLAISIVGEVNKPGRYNIERDKVSIFDALALAGDLTIYADRENIAVVREKGGKNVVTKLDLRSKDIFLSPCFYLEQNDVLIVSPNKYRAATAEINQNRSFWISIASTAVSLATLVVTIFSISK